MASLIKLVAWNCWWRWREWRGRALPQFLSADWRIHHQRTQGDD